jgi:hypothetical protein
MYDEFKQPSKQYENAPQRISQHKLSESEFQQALINPNHPAHTDAVDFNNYRKDQQAVNDYNTEIYKKYGR